MEQLDVEGGFSIHEYRSGLKLLEQGRSTTTVENRAEYPCPVCGNPFDRLLVAEDGEQFFGEGLPGPVCLRTAGDQLLVLTH
jgi:hypothetical protein